MQIALFPKIVVNILWVIFSAALGPSHVTVVCELLMKSWLAAAARNAADASATRAGRTHTGRARFLSFQRRGTRLLFWVNRLNRRERRLFSRTESAEHTKVLFLRLNPTLCAGVCFLYISLARTHNWTWAARGQEKQLRARNLWMNFPERKVRYCTFMCFARRRHTCPWNEFCSLSKWMCTLSPWQAASLTDVPTHSIRHTLWRSKNVLS
jgi:hypothetical protein